MKTLKLLSPALWAALFILAMWACQNENAEEPSVNASATTSAQDNTQIVAVTEDVLDITADGLTSEGFAGGRIAGDHEDDDDNDGTNGGGNCHPSISGTFDLDKTDPDSLIYTGTVTIDFGDGSSCEDSTHVRKGKIIDHYTITLVHHKNEGFTFSSTETITFEGFYKDSTQIDGTFIIKSSTGEPTTVEAKDAKITYADSTSFSWAGTLTFDYEKDSGSRHCKGNTMNVTGSLSGTTRTGADFTATITKELVFKRGCFGKSSFIPVSGTIDVTTGGVTSTIDYGDGSCDKDYTVTAAGVVTEYTYS